MTSLLTISRPTNEPFTLSDRATRCADELVAERVAWAKQLRAILLRAKAEIEGLHEPMPEGMWPARGYDLESTLSMLDDLASEPEPQMLRDWETTANEIACEEEDEEDGRV